MACEDEGTKEKKKASKHDDAYSPKPFPSAWIDILAIVDVCANTTTPIVFCDKEGYDIIPIYMVKVIQRESGYKEEKHNHKKVSVEIPMEEITTELIQLHLHNKIFIINKSDKAKNKDKDTGSTIEDGGPSDQTFYDALDELDKFEEAPESITIKLHNGWRYAYHVSLYKWKSEEEDNTKGGQGGRACQIFETKSITT